MKSNIDAEFQNEIKVIKEAKKVLETEKISIKFLLEKYQILLKSYQRLFRQTKTLTKVSDNQQHRLKIIMERLGKYVSYQLFKKITQGKEKVELVTKRKKLTVFFSDIKDFSYISSHMEGEALATFLNSYLDEMTKIVIKWGGNLDKYWGDAILAFFGDPVFISDEDHAFRCVNMAIEMQKKMRDLQKLWFDHGYQEPLQIRIGIATGFCAVGNFGSSERMDYTIIGNPVNLAARLESSAEAGEILISHETWGLIKNKIICEPYISLSLKGFHQNMIAHKVLRIKDSSKNDILEIDAPDNGIKLKIDFSIAKNEVLRNIIKEINKKIN